MKADSKNGGLLELSKVFLKGIVLTVSEQRKYWFGMELQTHVGLIHIHALVNKAMRKPSCIKYRITHASK
jgi:hypothetical protein